MIKKTNDKQYISIDLDTHNESDKQVWDFCQNGNHSTGVSVSLEQFDMLKEMVNDHRIVEFYESLRNNDNENS